MLKKITSHIMIHIMIHVIIEIIILSSCSGKPIELKFEFDNNMSIESGITNMKTFYDVFSSIQNKYIDNIIFKISISSVLSWVTLAIGHENFGHGYPLRLKNIDYHIDYYLPPTITFKKCQDPFVESCINIGGFNFENGLKKEFVKEQTMYGIDYMNSMMINTIRFGYYVTSRNKTESTNDLINIEKSWKKINPETNLSRKDIDQIIFETTFFDPISTISYFSSTYLLLNNKSEVYKLRIIPTFDFNLYPIGYTREIGLSTSVYGHYLRIGYEFGKDLWNKNIEGMNIEITNIKLCDILKIDLKMNSIDYIQSKINIKNFYIAWKYHINQDYTVEPKNRFSVGCKFF